MMDSYIKNGLTMDFFVTIFDRNNISFIWYTDGIPVFKSSKISLWPVHLTVNELPFEDRKRRENTLLVGYWYNDKKPQMNTFLYKFMKTFQEIVEGVQITLPDNNIIIVKGIILMGTCDLPAKCDCLNFIQFNDDYGCHSCLCKGEHIEIGPRSHVHAYPFENELTLRTSQQSIEFANRAKSDTPFMGVKGHTVISKIMPDFINGMAIDRMHCVDGGVMKKLMTLFFDQKYSDTPFSLYAVIDIINRRLISIKPPKFIHRMPRSVTDLMHWKASEIKCFFLLFYSCFQKCNARRLFRTLFTISCSCKTSKF